MEAQPFTEQLLPEAATTSGSGGSKFSARRAVAVLAFATAILASAALAGFLRPDLQQAARSSEILAQAQSARIATLEQRIATLEQERTAFCNGATQPVTTTTPPSLTGTWDIHGVHGAGNIHVVITGDGAVQVFNPNGDNIGAATIAVTSTGEVHSTGEWGGRSPTIHGHLDGDVITWETGIPPWRRRPEATTTTTTTTAFLLAGTWDMPASGPIPPQHAVVAGNGTFHIFDVNGNNIFTQGGMSEQGAMTITVTSPGEVQLNIFGNTVTGHLDDDVITWAPPPPNQRGAQIPVWRHRAEPAWGRRWEDTTTPTPVTEASPLAGTWVDGTAGHMFEARGRRVPSHWVEGAGQRYEVAADGRVEQFGGPFGNTPGSTGHLTFEAAVLGHMPGGTFSNGTVQADWGNGYETDHGRLDGDTITWDNSGSSPWRRA